MNFFIDFDHTLYNASMLAKDMLEKLAKYISDKTLISFNEILVNLNSKFTRGGIYDIYDLIAYFSKLYHFEAQDAINCVNNVIFNGQKYLYSDSVSFLKHLKENGHKVYILSYNEKRVYFQTVKIAGSGLLDYTDGIIPTTTLKGDMPLDFSKGIFIDDKPKDLISIYQNNPLKIYRIRRTNDTYSNLETNLPIEEFSSLDELKNKF